MKQNIIRYTIGALISLAGMQACTKDHSTLDTNRIQGVAVDTTGTGTIAVNQFDTLTLIPHIDAGKLTDDALTYEWKINPNISDTAYQVLATSRNLKAAIKLLPSPTQQSYRLVLTVTDKSNGLKYITPYKVNVLNNIGEGLVIADSKDGLHSDIHLLMMPWVTSNYDKESLKKGVYSTINRKEIDGVVKQLRSYQFFRDLVVQGITENSIFNIKKLDYTLLGMNNALFYAPRATFNPQALGAIFQGDLYVDNGMLTGANMAASAKMPNPFDTKFTAPSILGMAANSDAKVILNFYDEVNGHFVYLKSMFFDKTLYKHPATPAAAFDASNMPGQLNLAAGLSPDKDFLHLLKDKATGNIRLYVFSKGTDDGGMITYPPAPKQIIDFSGAPGIAAAHHFVFAEDQRVMYYVSGNKIYAALFGSSTPSFQERYTLPAGAELTALSIYQQGQYPIIDPTIPTHNKVLIMASFAGGEGKLTLFPMINLGIGNLDIANRKEYGGFGRISAVTSQR